MIGKEADRDLNEEDWLYESHLLAVTFVYDAEVTSHLKAHERAGIEPGRLEISERYPKAGGVSRHQIVKAGVRLGAVLKEVVRVSQLPKNAPRVMPINVIANRLIVARSSRLR